MDRDAFLAQLWPEDPVLADLRRRSEDAGLPPITVPPLVGRLLTLLVRATGAREVLEVGTLGGYSAVCLARGLPPGGRVTTIEREERHAAVAAANLRRAGVADRVELRRGPAREVLAALEREGRRFDFLFLDADKENYSAYLDALLALARPGALLVADNALWHDRVLDPTDRDPTTEGVRRFDEALARHPRLFSLLLPVGDGVALAVVTAAADAAPA